MTIDVAWFNVVYVALRVHCVRPKSLAAILSNTAGLRPAAILTPSKHET